MKFFLLLSLIWIAIPGFSQQPYRCEYKQSLKLKLADSSIRQLRRQIVEQGIGESMADQLVAQVAEEGVEQEFLITVNAALTLLL